MNNNPQIVPKPYANHRAKKNQERISHEKTYANILPNHRYRTRLSPCPTPIQTIERRIHENQNLQKRRQNLL